MSGTINMLDSKSSVSKLVHALESGQARECFLVPDDIDARNPDLRRQMEGRN